MELPHPDTPVMCDLSAATDTPEQRLDEYHRLFAKALVSRERTENDGVRFRLRTADGVESWVRDLAAREKACCAFFAFEITVDGDEVVWDAEVIDNETAHAVLDEFYALTENTTDSVDDLRARFTERRLALRQDRSPIPRTGARLPGPLSPHQPPSSAGRPPLRGRRASSRRGSRSW